METMDSPKLDMSSKKTDGKDIKKMSDGNTGGTETYKVTIKNTDPTNFKVNGESYNMTKKGTVSGDYNGSAKVYKAFDDAKADKTNKTKVNGVKPYMEERGAGGEIKVLNKLNPDFQRQLKLANLVEDGKSPADIQKTLDRQFPVGAR